MVTGDVLAIERNGFMVFLANLDPREDYPKPKLVETTVKVSIRGEGYVMQIGSLLKVK